MMTQLMRIASPGLNGLTDLPMNIMTAVFADDSFNCIFVNETFRILNEILLNWVPKGSIDNNPVLV